MATSQAAAKKQLAYLQQLQLQQQMKVDEMKVQQRQQMDRGPTQYPSQELSPYHPQQIRETQMAGKETQARHWHRAQQRERNGRQRSDVRHWRQSRHYTAIGTAPRDQGVGGGGDVGFQFAGVTSWRHYRPVRRWAAKNSRPRVRGIGTADMLQRIRDIHLGRRVPGVRRLAGNIHASQGTIGFPSQALVDRRLRRRRGRRVHARLPPTPLGQRLRLQRGRHQSPPRIGRYLLYFGD
jgi:hypothetical protein